MKIGFMNGIEHKGLVLVLNRIRIKFRTVTYMKIKRIVMKK